MSELLRIDELCIGLKQPSKPIVKGVSFSLQKGTVLAVVGESGSGKTLTCKSIMRLLNPKIFEVSGSILFRGDDMLAMSEKRVRSLCGNKLAMIVQNPMSAFDPSAKIGSQIVETIRAHMPMPRSKAYALSLRALEEMNLPRCEQLLNSYPFTLSGGMLQRIVIALSLIHKPEMIIADEATTALDVKNQNMVLEMLQKMKRQGIGVLLVTHDFGVAAKLADHVIVMRNGVIVEHGTIFDIFDHPVDDYTKSLLTSSILGGGTQYGRN